MIHVVAAQGKQYLTSMSKLETAGTTVEGLRNDLDSCRKNLESRNERLRIDRGNIATTKLKFDLALKEFEDELQETITPETTAVKPKGIVLETEEEGVKELPEDCTDILFANPQATEGFYDIKPACSNDTLRVYCDMETHKGLYLYHGFPPKEPGTILTRDIWRPEEVLKRCEKVCCDVDKYY